MNIKVILLSKQTTQFVSTSNLKNNGKLKKIKRGRGIWDFFFNKLIVKTNTHHLGEPSFNNL